MNTSDLPALAVIAGPTASGKSALALALAKQVNGTIINADSAQVYRDLRILTARPDAAEEAQVPHRLFGHVDAADAGYSAARWAAEARAAIEETVAAGRRPILVGGTGLYLRTLLDGIAAVPPIDAAIRAEVRALPVAAAHAALGGLDAAAAARLHPNDTARVARALEVIRSTGRPLTTWQSARHGGIGEAFAVSAVVLLPDRAALYAGIDRRAAAMMASGVEDEVAALLARSAIPADAPVRRAIGVAAVSGWIMGKLDRQAATVQLALDTRRYAKRQYTWLRHQPPTTWHRLNDYSIHRQSDAIKLLLMVDGGGSGP